MISSLAAGLVLCVGIPTIAAYAEESDVTAPVSDVQEEILVTEPDEPDVTAPTSDVQEETPVTDPDESGSETEEEPLQDGFLYHEDGTVSYVADGVIRTGKFSVVPDYTIGDINGDTAVGSTDAADILTAAATAGAGDLNTEDYLLENSPCFSDLETVIRHADVNSDTAIDAADAAAILYYAAMVGSGAQVNPLGYAAYFADENGILLQGSIIDEAGLHYYAKEDYSLLTGWHEQDGKRYYYTPDAVMVNTGLTEISGTNYYFTEDGSLLCGEMLEIDGITYYFAENGARASGWQSMADGVRYFNTDGAMLTGWQVIQEKTYRFDEAGLMLTGLQTIDENQYYFDADGAMCTGFVKLTDGVRYFNADGAMLTGWQKIEEKTHHFNENGLMSIGWTDIEGKRYHFNASGIMYTGLIKMADGSYYFGDEGVMQTGWQTISGKQYYFGEDGKMVTNQTVDGFIIGSDGVAMSQALSNITAQAQSILAANGTSVNEIYNYMRATNRYKKTEATKTLAQIEELGWTYFVQYSMDHYYVVCYYLAAKMDFLLREAGHTCRVVHATHGSGDHYWNQVYVNGTWVNYDCTNGYRAYGWDAMISAGNYKVLGYLTPEYK